MKKLLALLVAMMLLLGSVVAFATEDGLNTPDDEISQINEDGDGQDEDDEDDDLDEDDDPDEDEHIHFYNEENNQVETETSTECKPISETEHEYTVTTTTTTTCECGEATDVTVEVVTYTEAHFDAEEEEGVCVACGYEKQEEDPEFGEEDNNTCKKDGHNWNEDDEESEPLFDDYDSSLATDAGHYYVYEVRITIKCDTCGGKKTKTEKYSLFEAHTFEKTTDGKTVCLECGYELKPAATTKTEKTDDDMPKTGETGLTNAAWAALTAMCFVGFMVARKRRVMGK